MANNQLELILDLSRVEDAADPFRFRCVSQKYLRNDEGKVWSASLKWGPELLGDLSELTRWAPDSARVKRLGDTLRTFLVGLGWEAEERRLVEALEARRSIHLTFRFAAAELYSLPWELVTLEPTRQYLGGRPDCLIRYEWPKTKTARAMPSPPPAGGRILLAWSMAGGPVGALEHVRALSNACAKAEYPFKPERDVLNHVSLEALSRALTTVQEPVAVLHILCHGVRVGESAYGLLWGTVNEPQQVDGETLKQALAPHVGQIRLVVLSACHSGDPGELGNNLGSVAQALHTLGVAAVVASRLPLTIRGSVQIAGTLYPRLLAGAPLDEALAVVRIQLAQRPPSLDWAALQLYARRAEAPNLWPIVFRPYRGLLAFEAQHRRFLFGRKDLQRALVRRVREALKGKRPRFQVVAGASGSGKSSLVKAGLVPLLSRSTWNTRVVRPGELETAEVNRLRQSRGGRRLLLVVDQFEEVFTRLPSIEERQAFVRALWALAASAESNAVVVITLRLDYFERCREILLDDSGARLDDTVLDDAHRVFLRPLQPRQLEAVIEGPAKRVGLELEAGLVERLRKDVEQEIGGLPLLEYALDQLWQRRNGNTLSHADYGAIGGVPGALTRTADVIYEGLSPLEQREARRLWLALVDFGEKASPHTRRRVRRAQVRPASPEAQAAFDHVAEKFIAHRFLVVGGGSEAPGDAGQLWLEPAHEALLQSWQRLAQWVHENREREVELRRLDSWAQEWREKKRDRDGGASYLLSGDRLVQARNLKERYSGELSVESERLIQTSWARSEAERLRELQRQRSLRRLSVGLGVGLLLAIGFGGFAFIQWGEAVRQRGEAVQARKVAMARELAATARSKMEEDPELGMALMVHAHRVAPRERVSDPDVLSAWQSQRKRALLQGHTKAVNTAVFSPDGLRVVTASDDNTARIWDVSSGRQLAQLTGHTKAVRTAVFSPDGLRVVTTSNDNTARIWDVSSGMQLALLSGNFGEVLTVAFSPDGVRVITTSVDNTARIWDASSGRQLAQLTGHTLGISTAEFSPDGLRVVTASLDNTARIWDASSGKQLVLLSGHFGWVWAAKFSPDGLRVLTIGHDHTARTWDASSGVELAVFRHINRVSTAEFSPDGLRVVSVAYEDFAAYIWDASSGMHLVQLTGHTDWVSTAKFSPDGLRVVTASQDHTARIWEASSGMQLALLRDQSRAMRRPAFSPDGLRIVTVSDDNTARIWNVIPGKQLALLTGHAGAVWTAAFSRDGFRVVTTSEDNTARIWDATSGKQLTLLTGHTLAVTTDPFTPNGFRIATVSDDNTARIWDASGRQLALLTGHRREMTKAAFSPDGLRIVTVSGNHTARIWDAASGKQLALLTGHTAPVQKASFSPDGTRVVTTSQDRTARIWDATSGEQLALLTGYTLAVSTDPFSPHGFRIVTVSDDNAARIWDESGKQLTLLTGHTGSVWTAAFSPDGLRIVTASYDHTARIWDVGSGRQLALLTGGSHQVTQAAFSPDGLRIVTVNGDDTAHIWDASSGEQLALLTGQTRAASKGAFSPDCLRLVTASEDRTARIWDAASGKQLALLTGHTGAVRTAEFSPDGFRVLTASDDKTARIWACELCAPADTLFERWSRELTCQERRTYLHEDNPCPESSPPRTARREP